MDIEFPYKNEELRFFCFLPPQICWLVLTESPQNGLTEYPITYIYVKSALTQINSLNTKVTINQSIDLQEK